MRVLPNFLQLNRSLKSEEDTSTRGNAMLRYENVKKGAILPILSFTLLSFFPIVGNTGEISKYVEAEGMAPISTDIGLSRDIAILRAKQTAIEQAGVGLKSETIVNMGFLLDDIVKIQTFALVKSYEVVSENREENLYKVKIRAKIISKKKETAVMQNLFAHRSILVKATGKGSGLLKKKLLAQLTKGGYFMLDPGLSKWNSDYKILIASGIEASQKTEGIVSYYVESEIRLVKRVNGKVLILETEPQDNIVFGLNKSQALRSSGPNAFPSKIVEPMVKEFMRRIKVSVYVKEHDVDIIVKNIPNHRIFREDFCKMLRTLRLGVQNLSNEHYDRGTGRVTVHYTEKTDYLAAMIGFRNRYKVEKAARNQIQVVFQER